MCQMMLSGGVGLKAHNNYLVLKVEQHAWQSILQHK